MVRHGQICCRVAEQQSRVVCGIKMLQMFAGAFKRCLPTILAIKHAIIFAYIVWCISTSGCFCRGAPLTCKIAHAPPGGYSQWQSQTVARREGNCRSPANNQFYIHDNSPGDRVYGQTAEHSNSRSHNPLDNENIILWT